MKHSIMLTALAVLLLAACRKEKSDFVRQPETVRKTVAFSLSQARDYQEPVYAGVRAQVKLSVSKINKADGRSVVLWDSTIAFKPLREFPEVHRPVGVTKSFNGIDDNRESVSASYFIQYRDAQDRINSEGRNVFAAAGLSTLTLPVRL